MASWSESARRGLRSQGLRRKGEPAGQPAAALVTAGVGESQVSAPQPTREVLDQPRPDAAGSRPASPSRAESTCAQNKEESSVQQRSPGSVARVSGTPSASDPLLCLAKAFLSLSISTPASAVAPKSPVPQNAWAPPPRPGLPPECPLGGWRGRCPPQAPGCV